jgi:hypothetical protein
MSRQQLKLNRSVIFQQGLVGNNYLSNISTEDFSLLFWFQTSQLPVDYLILNIVQTLDKFITLRYDQPTDSVIHIKAGFGDGSRVGDIICTHDVNPNTNPHMLAVTCDRNSPTGLNLYFDGVLVDTQDPTSLDGISYTPDGSIFGGIYFNHGATPQGFDLTYNFYVDHLRVYIGTALSPLQIAGIWNNNLGVYADESIFQTLVPDTITAGSGGYCEFNTGNPVTNIQPARALHFERAGRVVWTDTSFVIASGYDTSDISIISGGVVYDPVEIIDFSDTGGVQMLEDLVDIWAF